MTVIAMKVVDKRAHPNADSLVIYTLRAPGVERLQVVANMERTYAEGDVVAVARIGTVLEDGTRIRKARLRGEDSYGMAMGQVEAELGEDLTARYAQVEGESETPDVEHIPWPSIELLHNVRRRLADEGHAPVISYRAKIKLDGTNAGVQLLPDGGVVAQSRSRIITPDDDNMGFAAWVEERHAWFEAQARPEERTVIFGEWCGQGIQKRTAVSKLDRRLFAVFAIQVGDHAVEPATLEVDPARLRERLTPHPDVVILPWTGARFTFDFGERGAMRAAAEALNAHVESVEVCDPWVRERFGVEGIGEGVVLYPDPEGEAVGRGVYAERMFKAKGEAHRVVRQRKAAQLDPAVAESVEAFVEIFVTTARLEQGIAAIAPEGAPLRMEQMGDFLTWFGRDVKKESVDELEASGLSWRQVSRAVTRAARDAFRGRVQAL